MTDDGHDRTRRQFDRPTAEELYAQSQGTNRCTHRWRVVEAGRDANPFLVVQCEHCNRRGRVVVLSVEEWQTAADDAGEMIWEDNERVAVETVAKKTKLLGLKCARCGCHNFEVDTTRRIDAGVRRYRICRSCGYRLVTREVA